MLDPQHKKNNYIIVYIYIYIIANIYIYILTYIESHLGRALGRRGHLKLLRHDKTY